MTGPAYLEPSEKPTAVQLAAWIRCAGDDEIVAAVDYLERLLEGAELLDRIRTGLMAVVPQEDLARGVTVDIEALVTLTPPEDQ